MDLHPYHFCQESTASLRTPKLLSPFFYRLLPQHWMTPFTAGGLQSHPLLGYMPWRPLTYLLPHPGIVPVYLYPRKTEAPRTAVLPSRQRCHKSESTYHHDNIYIASVGGRCFCTGGLGVGHRGAFLTLLSPPRGQGVEGVKEAC